MLDNNRLYSTDQEQYRLVSMAWSPLDVFPRGAEYRDIFEITMKHEILDFGKQWMKTNIFVIQFGPRLWMSTPLDNRFYYKEIIFIVK